ncbi:MAG: hypothetical protein DDT36_00398 [Firmicutes bacterium]|nr:hypothetical protein [Bacillota bacterium]
MSEEKRIVLQMLSDGKITAGDAANLILALGEHAERTPSLERDSRGNFKTKDMERRARLRAKVVAREARERLRAQLQGTKKLLQEHLHEARAVVQENRNSGGVWGIIGNLFDGLGQPNFSWQETLSGRVAEGAATKIIISGVNGKIEIAPSPDASWHLEVEKCVYAKDSEEARERATRLYSVESGDHALHITAKQVFGQRSIVHFRLLWPKEKQCDLDLKSTNGSVRIGPLTLGSVRVTTTNGRVEIDSDAEAVHLSSINGRILLVGAAGAITGSVVNGRLTILCRTPEEGAWTLHTVNGRILVRLGERRTLGTRCRASAVYGGVTCNLPHHEVKIEQGGVLPFVNKSLEAVRQGKFDHWLTITADSVNGRVTIDPYIDSVENEGNF